jgi:hypothetical protein
MAAAHLQALDVRLELGRVLQVDIEGNDVYAGCAPAEVFCRGYAWKETCATLSSDAQQGDQDGVFSPCQGSREQRLTEVGKCDQRGGVHGLDCQAEALRRGQGCKKRH